MIAQFQVKMYNTNLIMVSRICGFLQAVGPLGSERPYASYENYKYQKQYGSSAEQLRYRHFFLFMLCLRKKIHTQPTSYSRVKWKALQPIELKLTENGIGGWNRSSLPENSFRNSLYLVLGIVLSEERILDIHKIV